MNEQNDQQDLEKSRPSEEMKKIQQNTKSDSITTQHLHSEFILNGLQVLKTNNLLCDVVLIAENKQFHVHKILLASVSDYFRSMFTSGMRETSQTSIELKGVSARGLEKVIEIIYTSHTRFDSYTDIFDVIAAATHLQCLLVIDYCEKNFLDRLTSTNFNYFIHMARLYDLPNALKQIELFIVNNFAQIVISGHAMPRASKKPKSAASSRSSHGKNAVGVANHDYDNDEENMSGAKYLSYEQMLTCLRHDELKLREIDLFMLTWRWINECLLLLHVDHLETHDTSEWDEDEDDENDDSSKSAHRPASRRVNNKRIRRCSKLEVDLKRRVRIESGACMRKIDMIRNLLACIRFCLISPSDIIERVQTVNDGVMLKDKMLRKLVINALNYHLTLDNQCLLTRPHFATDENNSLPFNLKIRSPVKCVLAVGGREINPNPSLNDSCWILTDFLNINNNCANSANTTVQRTRVGTLPLSLSHMQAVVVDNFLYILGGCISQCAHGESAVSNTFRFDPRLAKWTSIAPMLERRAYFYACSLKSSNELNSKEYIVSFGGKNRDGALSSVERLDPTTNEWSYVQALASSYYAHAGVCVNNTAYLSGGYSNANFTTDLLAFSLVTNRWTQLRPMHAARGWHSMCVVNDNLYVFGGCYLVSPVFAAASNQTLLNQQQQQQQQQQMAQPVTVTEFYSPATDQWTIVKPMANLHKEASHFLLGQHVYIFGGYNIAAKTGQKLMSRYDTVNDLWQTIGQLPSGMTGVGCCVLDLPWFLLDPNQSIRRLTSTFSNEEIRESTGFDGYKCNFPSNAMKCQIDEEEDEREEEECDEESKSSDEDEYSEDGGENDHVNEELRNEIETSQTTSTCDNAKQTRTDL